MKRGISSLVSGLLVLAMVFSFIPAQLFADEGEEVVGLTVRAYPEEAIGDVYRVEGRDVYVSCITPCKLGYYNGEKYVCLKCLKEGPSTYRFYVPAGTDDVALVIFGDTDLNGRITQADATKVKAYLKGNTTLDAVQRLAGDVNSDNRMTNADAIKIKAYLKGTVDFDWDLGTVTECTVEHYKQTGAGSEEYVKDESLTDELRFVAGITVTAEEKAVAGYVFDVDNENNIKAGLTAEGQRLVLKLYYKVDADGDGTPDDEQMYTVRFFDCDLTDGGLLSEEQYRWGTEVEDLEVPEPRHEGYTFMGWQPELERVTRDADYTAVFTPNGETPYKVEYYKQTEAGSSEFLRDDYLTEFLSGVTDSPVEKEPPVLIGYAFDEDNIDNKLSGMIHPDGSLVLKLYYKIDADNDGTPDDEQKYVVTFVDWDGTFLSSDQYLWGTPAEDLEVLEVSRQGYTFIGWEPELARVTGKATYKADYIANDNTPFRVEYYKQTQAGREEYLKDDLLTEYRVGTTDTVVTATPPELLLYAFDEDNENNVLRGTVYGDGSLVLKLYYKVDSDGNGIPDDEEMFTITFVDEDGETVLSREQYLRGTQPEDIVQPAAVKEGYTFAGWDPELAEVTADATYRATYTPNGDTPYVVEYFVQAMAGSEVYYKSENLTERYTGTTGDTVSAEPKTVTNFVFDEDNENNVISGVIAADGSLALKLYYKVDADGDGLADDEEAILTFVDEDGTTVIEKKNYLIGTPASEVEAPSPVKEGYTFAGWDPEIADVTADATYRATYTANTDTPYTVEYYKQSRAGTDEYAKDDLLTEFLTGTTDQTASKEAPELSGYAFDEDNENNILSGIIAADGSLVLKLYYKIDTNGDGVPDDEQMHTITFYDEDGTTVLLSRQFLHGTNLENLSQPANSQNYIISGWIPELAVVTEDASYTAVYDKTLEFVKFGSNYAVKAGPDISGVTEITIPGSFKNSDVTKIDDGQYSGVTPSGAFVRCTNLTKVILPDTIKYIGDHAFRGCSALESINLPDGLKSIGGYAFSFCSSLSGTITIPSGVTEIKSSLFRSCENVAKIELHDGITKIAENAFYGCSSLTGTFTVPSLVTDIRDYTFCDCSGLTEIVLPEGISTIGRSAFQGCSSLSGTFTVPSGVTEIESSTFSGCSSLEEVVLPSGITSIGGNAFNGCRSLSAVNIPSLVTDIGYYAFSGCSSLTEVSIPEGVTSLQHNIFSRCSSLDTVRLPHSIEEICSEAFKDDTSLASIYFNGYRREWNAIAKDATWDSNTGDYTVYCLDDDAEYTVTFLDEDGTTVLSSTSYPCGTAAADIVQPTASKQGYSFAGWSPELADVLEDAVYTATYTEATDTPYKVEYYKQTETGSGEFAKDELLTEFLSGTTNATVEKVPPVLLGYVFDEENARNVLSGTIYPDGSLVLSLYYKIDANNNGAPDEEDSYTVTFLDNDGTTVLGSGVYPWGTLPENIEQPAASKQGYTFAGWDPELAAVTADATYTATYAPAEDTPYTVEHFFQISVGSSVYSRGDTLTEHKSGTTGTSVSADPASVDGYVFDVDNVNNIASGTVAADGSLVLKLYYKIDANEDGTADDEAMHTITFVDDDGTTVLSSTQYAWGTPASQIEQPEATKEGYTFAAWTPALAKVTGDATYTATYTPNTDTPYTVEYYTQTETGEDMYTKDDSLTASLTGTTGTLVNAPQISISGYAFDQSNENNVSSGYISGDGSLVLKLYYGIDVDGNGTPDDKQYYTITFVDEDGTTVLSSRDYIWGTPAASIVQPVPNKPNYIFNGWSPALAMVTGDATYTATYVVDPGSQSHVLDYYLKSDDTYAVLAGADIATVTQVTVPETYDGKAVTSVYDNGFKNVDTLVRITLPSGMTKIGQYAFAECDRLTTVTISNTVTRIEKYAFQNCSGLTSITIPASVTYIGAGAFKGAAVTSITLSDTSGWTSDYSLNEVHVFYDNYGSYLTADTMTLTGFNYKLTYTYTDTYGSTRYNRASGSIAYTNKSTLAKMLKGDWNYTFPEKIFNSGVNGGARWYKFKYYNYAMHK